MINFILYHTPIFYLIQPLWRDEAFSYALAKLNPLQLIIATSKDFNPPFYYLILSFWMQIAGKSEIGLRLLSFTFHLATVYFSYKLASKMFSKKTAQFTALFTFLNPMLLYYSMEVRMYSLFALLTLCSLYFFYTKNWKTYIITTALGLYTHSFFPLITVSFTLYLALTKQLTKKNIILTLSPFILFLPWLPILLTQFLKSKGSWLYPVDFQLVESALGNLFTNYEGTPYYWWKYTALLSLVILSFLIFALIRRNKTALLFSTPILFPLTLILGYSMLKQPVYVNRYLIFITVFELLTIVLAINSIKNKVIRYATVITWLILIVVINILTPPYRAKTDFRKTFAEINPQATPEDYVYTKTPLTIFESLYYYKYPNRLFIYNPQNITIPNYLGITVISPNGISKTSLPKAPSKTFMIEDDASFEVIENKP